MASKRRNGETVKHLDKAKFKFGFEFGSSKIDLIKSDSLFPKHIH
jgi:hypothetical protein